MRLESPEIVVETWGKFACFTKPETKIERVSYPIMTPTAAVGLLSAIYIKPIEFYWNIRKIEILKPIRYISMMTNERKNKAPVSGKPVYRDGQVTQKNNQVLADVRYRITATIIPVGEYRTPKKLASLHKQAIRRLTQGQRIRVPYMGISNFWADGVILSDDSIPPVDVNMDVGLMIRDLWIHGPGLTEKEAFRRKYFHAVINHGVMAIPDADDESVIEEGQPWNSTT